MIRKDKILSRRRLGALIAAGAIAIGGGGYGIVSAIASTASATTTTASSASAASGHRVLGNGGSNARSGPAAGGSSGTVASVSSSSFTVLTGAGQKVTVKKASSTKYNKGTSSVSASAITKGESVLVLGTTSGTTITAGKVVVQQTGSDGSAASSAAGVVPFKRGATVHVKAGRSNPNQLQRGVGHDRQWNDGE